ncbi:hypothetical protein LOTGIDRAFT_171381 [Lottia gigantea]|uniref:Phospholipase A2-like domain-containing protein n=1 Tax=Lottia gigantea TaxID=225164 RepID=V4B7A6_LOTGI|nr:hypothetical protein LOTGIDRAFT_171381 [Lottia gigantea]ESP03441.1 hypothetical protein LOTGIDRAFT_171381 [Lottia gigantea]
MDTLCLGACLVKYNKVMKEAANQNISNNLTAPSLSFKDLLQLLHLTCLDLRLDSNDNPKPREEPINRIDQAALKHDILYRDHTDLESRHKVDQQMINENPTFKEKVERAIVTRLLKSKIKLGMGIKNSEKLKT